MISLHIALRYLFSRKGHNVINLISAVAGTGIAVGVAALVLILSVYNGFDRIVEDNMGELAPDFLIAPSEGKYFVPDSIAEVIAANPEVADITGVLEENVAISYGSRQSAAVARGVDSGAGDDECLVGAGLASRNNINPALLSPINIWYPRKDAAVLPLSPEEALGNVRVFPSGILPAGSASEAGLIILPLATMERLLGRSGEVSALYVNLNPGTNPRRFSRRLSEVLGDGFLVLGRKEQNRALYRMMRGEKAAIALILFFLVLVVALNIYGSLTMLTIEKRDDIFALEACGASKATIRNIFLYNGLAVSMLGMIVGLAVGLALALLQMHTGLAKMPGTFSTEAYPVVIKFTDIVLAASGALLAGLTVSSAAARGAAKRS